MNYLDLKKEGKVFVLTLINGNNGNTFSNDVLKDYNAVIDEIENTTENASLIITSDHPKTWSNGINLEWMMKLPQNELLEFVLNLKRTLLRMTLLNLPTIGCLTGNAYAAGAIMASGLDFRLMRADRGRFCFPEVNIQIPLGGTFTEIVKLLPNRHALNELALTGVAWGGEECYPKNVVDAIYSAEELPGKAMELAEMMADKDRKTYIEIKRDMRKDLVIMQKEDNIS